MGASPLELAGAWPVSNVAAAVISPGGIVDSYGDINRGFPLASITKLLTAYAVLVAVEEGSVGLDDAAGPATVRHLLAHASGLAPEQPRALAEPGRRRIYSNAGFEVLGDHLAAATGVAAPSYVHEAVFEPLAMSSSTLVGSPAKAAVATVTDMARFVSELMAPQIIDPATAAMATAVQFPGLDGVLPGFGRQSPNDWGLGFEIRSQKHPHWTGLTNSPATFGHFGRSGTMLWVDPARSIALVCLTDRVFGAW
ncbi:MAG: pbpE1, partial [Acidimicrobiia bacterium]|nr:pbpE1 [Acidimicrobiia bacterium]